MAPRSALGPVIPGSGPENPVNPWTKKAQSRTPRPVISSMGARHGPTSEKGLSQETVPPLENQQVAYHTKQIMWRICLDSALYRAEYVMRNPKCLAIVKVKLLGG